MTTTYKLQPAGRDLLLRIWQAGGTMKSGTTDRYAVASLVRNGLVELADGEVALTDAGLGVAGNLAGAAS